MSDDVLRRHADLRVLLTEALSRVSVTRMHMIGLENAAVNATKTTGRVALANRLFALSNDVAFLYELLQHMNDTLTKSSEELE